MSMRKLIRADGTTQDLPAPQSASALGDMIGADVLTTVNLRHMGYPLHVMLVDDIGVAKGLQVNVEATRLYHANCKPGVTHQIRGDVVVVPNEDFA